MHRGFAQLSRILPNRLYLKGTLCCLLYMQVFSLFFGLVDTSNHPPTTLENELPFPKHRTGHSKTRPECHLLNHISRLQRPHVLSKRCPHTHERVTAMINSSLASHLAQKSIRLLVLPKKIMASWKQLSDHCQTILCMSHAANRKCVMTQLKFLLPQLFKRKTKNV